MIVEFVKDDKEIIICRRLYDAPVNKNIENYKYISEYENLVSTIFISFFEFELRY